MCKALLNCCGYIRWVSRQSKVSQWGLSIYLMLTNIWHILVFAGNVLPNQKLQGKNGGHTVFTPVNHLQLFIET